MRGPTQAAVASCGHKLLDVEKQEKWSGARLSIGHLKQVPAPWGIHPGTQQGMVRKQ